MNLYDEMGNLIDTDTAINVDDIVKVAAFIAWHESHDLWGGVKRDEAFKAFCRIAGIKDINRVFEIIRPAFAKF